MDEPLNQKIVNKIITKTKVNIALHKKEFRFGKYKSQSFKEVIQKDHEYVHWVLDNCKPKTKIMGEDLASLNEFCIQEGLQKYKTEEEKVLARSLVRDEEILKDLWHNMDSDPTRYRLIFGKHKGETLSEIHASDSGYLEWLLKMNKDIAIQYLEDKAAFVPQSSKEKTTKMLVDFNDSLLNVTMQVTCKS